MPSTFRLHFPFSPTVEYFRLLLPKGRSHHAGVGAGGGGSAEAGPGERRDPEQAIPPSPSLWLPVAVPVCQAGRAMCWPTARCAQKCWADIVLHHCCPWDLAAAANMAYCGLEGNMQECLILIWSWRLSSLLFVQKLQIRRWFREKVLCKD